MCVRAKIVGVERLTSSGLQGRQRFRGMWKTLARMGDTQTHAHAYAHTHTHVHCLFGQRKEF